MLSVLALSFHTAPPSIPVSHHAMIRVTEKAAISYSPKAMVFTGDQPPESDPARGRSLLTYPWLTLVLMDLAYLLLLLLGWIRLRRRPARNDT